MRITVKRTPSGWYHVRGQGPCEWAQPPEWPCNEEMLREHAFPEASDIFIREALRAAEAIMKITDAMSIIESAAGFSDETTPAGEAWLVIVKEIERLQVIMDGLPPELHKRRCRDCGNVAYHADNITPYVLCRKCGSQDTRLIRDAEASGGET